MVMTEMIKYQPYPWLWLKWSNINLTHGHDWNDQISTIPMAM